MINGASFVMVDVHFQHDFTVPEACQKCPQVVQKLTAASLKIPDSGFRLELGAVQPFIGMRLTGDNAAIAVGGASDLTEKNQMLF